MDNKSCTQQPNCGFTVLLVYAWLASSRQQLISRYTVDPYYKWAHIYFIHNRLCLRCFEWYHMQTLCHNITMTIAIGSTRSIFHLAPLIIWKLLFELIFKVRASLYTVFIGSLATATINFSLAWVWLMTNRGWLLFNFRMIFHGIIHKNLSTED